MVGDHGLNLGEADDLDGDSFDNHLVGEAVEDLSRDVVIGLAADFGEDDKGGEDEREAGGDDEGEEDA